MTEEIAELVGVICVVLGAFALVGAAALVSTALAVLAVAVIFIVGGVVTVFVANKVAAKKKADEKASGAR